MELIRILVTYIMLPSKTILHHLCWCKVAYKNELVNEIFRLCMFKRKVRYLMSNSFAGIVSKDFGEFKLND